MDPEERRVRQAEMRLEQLRHQVGLRHSDLQRRFILALTLAGGLFLSFMRSKVPFAGVMAATPFLLWAGFEVWRIGQLAASAREMAEGIVQSLDEGPPPKGSRHRGEEVP